MFGWIGFSSNEFTSLEALERFVKFRFKIAITSFCLLFGGFFLYLYYDIRQENQLFSQGSELVEVQIINNQILKNKDNQNIADLSFTTKSGEKIVVKRSFIHVDEVPKIQRGETIERRYAVKNPQKLRLPNRTNTPAGVELILGIILFSLGIYLFWRILKTVLLQAKSKSN